MTRKISAYARRLRRTEAAQHFNGAQWMDTIQRCRPYTADAPEWSGLSDTRPAATKALLTVREAADDLFHHRAQPDNSEPFDLCAHAVDVAHIRYMQIQPSTDNPAHAPLLAGKAMLSEVSARRRRTGRWGLTGPERKVLDVAIDLYEQVLLVSSPEQMHAAATMRFDGLAAGKVWIGQP